MHMEEGKDGGGHFWRKLPHHRTSGFEGVDGTWGLTPFYGVGQTDVLSQGFGGRAKGLLVS